MKKTKQPSSPVTRLGTAKSGSYSQIGERSDDPFVSVVRTLDTPPPEENLDELKANSQSTKRRLRQFRKKVRAECEKISIDFPQVRIRSLEETIKQFLVNSPSIDPKTLRQPLIKLIPLLKRFDWRDYDIVPGVRDQRDCGKGCWAYAATEAFESSVMMERGNFNFPIKAPINLDPVRVKVKYTLDCVRGKFCKGCGGGWHQIAFKHFVDFGIPLNAMTTSMIDYAKDDNLKQGRCKERIQGKSRKKEKDRFRAVGWDYVHLPCHKVPSPTMLKRALLKHGPLAVTMALDQHHEDFQNYGKVDSTGMDVVRPYYSKSTWPYAFHSVLLIGWDDEKRAWIMQNSYGQEWGYCCDGRPEASNGVRRDGRGFMYIRWGSNDIGRYAAWVQASLFDIKGMLEKIDMELHASE